MSKLKYFDGTTWKVVNGEVTGDTLPIGGIIPYGSETAPTNWLVCDGSAVSRIDYSELFAVIGTSFGAGDGSTTFNLPNLKGRVAVGQDSTQTEFDTIGETGGEKTHTLTSQEIPTMSALAPTSTSGGSIAYFSNSAIGGFNGSGAGAAIATINGGGQAHNILQPYQVVCYIIKAKQSAGVVANVSGAYSESETDTYSCDYINKISNYSTTEQVVGKWVDGKPIYRKVISGVTEAQGTFDVETISSNVKQVIKVDGFVVSGTTNLPIAYSNTGAPIFYFVDGNNLNIQVGNSSFAGKSWYATVEYLKTTD